MNKIKVMWNGKRMCDIYPFATRWQVFKYKVRRATFKTFRALLVASFVFGAFYSTFKVGVMAASPNVQNFAFEKQVDRLPVKIQALKDEMLDGLKKCESGGYDEDDGVIIMDTNDKLSIGQYMFQINTVIHYYKTLYVKEITKKDAILIALDEPKARALAADIIFTTDKGLTNWINCDKKNAMATNLKLIKKLEN